MKKNNAIRGVFSLVLVTTLAFAQERDGRLTGQVTGPFDGLVADAPLRATHINKKGVEPIIQFLIRFDPFYCEKGSILRNAVRIPYMTVPRADNSIEMRYN